jgi:Mannosyltransferase (PIG-V)
MLGENLKKLRNSRNGLLVRLGRGWPHHRMPIGFCVSTILASRFVLYLIGHLSQKFLGSHEGLAPSDPLLVLFTRWDADWYLSVAHHGYHLATDYTGPGWTNVAFFPLMPGLEALMSTLMPLKVTAIVLPNLSLVIGSVILYEWVRERFGERIARTTIMSVCFFPGSFVFSSGTSEALFFMLAVLSFQFLASRRWVPASLTASLLAITRPNGFAMACILGIAWLRDRFSNGLTSTTFRELLVIELIPVPLVAFMVFQYGRFGDAFAFLHAQYFWGSAFGWPFSDLFQVFRSTEPLRLRIGSGLALFTVAIFLTQVRYLTAEEVCFVLLSGALTTMSGWRISSALRYLIALYPIHVAFALLSTRQGWADIMVPCLAIVNGFLMVFWSQGGMLFV